MYTSRNKQVRTLHTTSVTKVDYRGAAASKNTVPEGLAWEESWNPGAVPSSPQTENTSKYRKS